VDLNGLMSSSTTRRSATPSRVDVSRTLPDAEWDACMDVNIKGIWNCCGSIEKPRVKALNGEL